MTITYTYSSNSTIPPKEITPFGERCFTNINGRLYDPVLCRMLSPDNFACPDRTIVSVGMQNATGTQGFNLFTGDPGLAPSNREKSTDPQTGRITYKKNKFGVDPDKYRHGIHYIEILGLKFGKDSEKIRHSIQNKLAHDRLKPGTPWFKVLDIKETFYFQFGSGGGYLC